MPICLAPVRGAAAFCLMAAACSASDEPRTIVVDTLPSGVVRVTSTAPAWRDSTEAWRVVESTRYGGPDGSAGELIQPGAVAVDEAGRVYVSDGKPAAIKVFDSSGAFVRTIGREGGGPGEFRVALMALRGGHLVIHDALQSRTTVFDTSGALVRSWTSSCCIWGSIAVDDSGRVYIPTWIESDTGAAARGAAYTRYRLDGTVIDTLYVPRRESETKQWTFASKATGVMVSLVPYTPSVASTFHPEGGFVVGWNGDGELVRSPSGEDTLRIIRWAWAPEPIPEAMRRDVVTRWSSEQPGWSAKRPRGRSPGWKTFRPRLRRSPASRSTRTAICGYSGLPRTAPSSPTSTSSIRTASGSVRCAFPRD